MRSYDRLWLWMQFILLSTSASSFIVSEHARCVLLDSVVDVSRNWEMNARIWLFLFGGTLEIVHGSFLRTIALLWNLNFAQVIIEMCRSCCIVIQSVPRYTTMNFRIGLWSLCRVVMFELSLDWAQFLKMLIIYCSLVTSAVGQVQY